ncbi:hypothetical protein BN863_23140 [Formosa agariphila KMM 3901]|uniref:Sulfotransferase domain-containing protein n=1 Tax=Formosa agariphila (strain DSM 15362 / KCTC 12365 / LMG 23005 / KMM 3901 / M-2Alg 35-1) TaxID=1347342 RepID=T2KNK5_FORAG|nr:hypothetical protein [Formosa agariphila]CDF80026.1 hypothetical protein BN863_23140 [Formosa agariphila KMM 3901]
MSLQITFLHSLSQRAGHNFLAQIIIQTGDFKTINYESYETLSTALFGDLHKKLNYSNHFVRAKDSKNIELQLIVDGYRKELLKLNSNILLKSPFLDSISQIEVFPKDKHIILLRDPYNLFVSVEKSIYNFRTTNIKTTIKRVCRPLYSLYFLLKWRKKMNFYHNLSSSSQFPNNVLLIKYEGLRENKTLEALSEFLEIKKLTVKDVGKVHNINSSFAPKDEQWKLHNKNVGDPNKRYKNAPLWIKLYCYLFLRKEREIHNKINDYSQFR